MRPALPANVSSITYSRNLRLRSDASNCGDARMRRSSARISSEVQSSWGTSTSTSEGALAVGTGLLAILNIPVPSGLRDSQVVGAHGGFEDALHEKRSWCGFTRDGSAVVVMLIPTASPERPFVFLRQQVLTFVTTRTSLIGRESYRYCTLVPRSRGHCTYRQVTQPLVEQN